MKIKETVDGAKSSFKRNIKTILMDVAVAGVSVFYVFYQALVLEPTNLNPIILVGQALLGIIVGILIKQALGENGFTRGYRTDEWKRAKDKYSNQCDMALPYVDKVDEFYEEQRAEKLQKNRKTRLAGHRMKYDDFFDANGDYIHKKIIHRHKYNKLKKKNPEYTHGENEIVLDLAQRICLQKCINLKIYVKNLFTEYESDLSADEHKEKSDKDQRASNLRKNTIGAIAIAMLGVYFVPTFTWNIGKILWALFQVGIWITFGIVQLYDNYNFVTVEKVEVLHLKETDITKFLKKCYDSEKEGREDFIKKFNLKTEPLKEEPKQKEEKKPKEPEVIEVEMTEEELKAKGLIN